jgi:hypothetical protein
MPIEIVTAYRVGELVFPTIQEAKAEELRDLLKPVSSESLKRWCGAIRAHLTSPTDEGYEAAAWGVLLEMERLIKPKVNLEQEAAD